MGKERKEGKKLPFLAAAYYEHVKAFSQDGMHVITVIVTRFTVSETLCF